MKISAVEVIIFSRLSIAKTDSPLQLTLPLTVTLFAKGTSVITAPVDPAMQGLCWGTFTLRVPDGLIKGSH